MLLVYKNSGHVWAHPDAPGFQTPARALLAQVPARVKGNSAVEDRRFVGLIQGLSDGRGT